MPGYEGVRKVGPDLGTISGKLTQDWVKKWLADPKAFKSEARMPKFWGNSNNTGMINGIDWDKRNIAEINAITSFLFSKSTSRTLLAKGSSGNPARGKELVETRGCMGCHAVGPIEEKPNRTQTRRRHGYNLASQGSKVSGNWLANWVSDPRVVWADSKMPSLRLPDSEVADVAAYLSSLKNPDWEKMPAPQTDPKSLDDVVYEFLRASSTEVKAKADLAAMNTDQKNLFAGERLIGRYGCYGCHNIPGFETAQPIGTELTEAGSKLVSQLDYGFLDIDHHSRAEWYKAKLHNPRVFDEGRVERPEELLKMPNFGLNDKEVESIVMVLTSLVKDPVPLEMKDRTPQAVIEGRALIAEKNCKGCHIVENLGGDIRAYLGTDVEKMMNWPPSLNTQGMKTQPEWLRTFLKDPGASNRPRPWMDLRMPTFHFTEHEISVILQYFATLDKVDPAWIDPTVESTPELLRAGEELFKKLECLKCHPTGAVTKAEGVAPNLQNVHVRLRPEWIRPWLLEPGEIAPDTRMPSFFPKDQSGKRKSSNAPDILGGDVDKQIQALRDHLFTLGGGKVKVK